MCVYMYTHTRVHLGKTTRTAKLGKFSNVPLAKGKILKYYYYSFVFEQLISKDPLQYKKCRHFAI